MCDITMFHFCLCSSCYMLWNFDKTEKHIEKVETKNFVIKSGFIMFWMNQTLNEFISIDFEHNESLARVCLKWKKNIPLGKKRKKRKAFGSDFSNQLTNGNCENLFWLCGFFIILSILSNFLVKMKTAKTSYESVFFFFRWLDVGD